MTAMYPYSKNKLSILSEIFIVNGQMVVRYEWIVFPSEIHSHQVNLIHYDL